MEWISLLGILGYFSVEDLRKKSIQLVPLLAAAIAGVLFHMYFSRISIWNLIGGMAVGAGLYIISVLSNERIGKGDALLMSVTGIFLGFWDNLMLLWVSMLVAMVAGIGAVLILKKNRRYEMPFIPFVFTGYLIYLSINRGGLA